MSWAPSNPTPAEPVLAGIDVSAEPTNQEDIVNPYFAGQGAIPAHWVSPIYNQRAVAVPSTTPSKK